MEIEQIADEQPDSLVRRMTSTRPSACAEFQARELAFAPRP